jgi:peptidoglycan hydrolase-like protein with peptidoglycan-binding domain
VVGVGVVLAVAAGFAARGLWPHGAHSATGVGSPVPVATATVVRTDLSARQAVAGTIGYLGGYTVLTEAGGVITWLPAPGSVLRRGQPLFSLAGQPVSLMYGAIPAWRDFSPGMTSGPDVRELQRNLAALGFDPGAADGTFGWGTEAAIDRWQLASGQTVTGAIALGAVAFLPGPLRVAAPALPLGSLVAPGATVLTGTSDTPVVTVLLAVGGPVVHRGDRVTVTLPDGSTTVSGQVSYVGPVSTSQGGGQVNNSAGSGQGSGGSASAVIPLTITIVGSAIPAQLDQAPVQVAITQQRDNGVLAVPVTALLAQPGGGYALQLSAPPHRLIRVQAGLMDDTTGLVEVTGPGLVPGMAVVEAQE